MIHHGDCLEVMAGMDPESVDAIVTDPPYDLLSASRNGSPRRNLGKPGNPFARHDRGGAAGGFMGKAWDGTGIAFDPATWEAALRVAKPSSYLLAFGGTRTVHRMTCAIEDAGWIIRDMLMWIYASGFPKGKANLKPAWEPIVMARKPGPLRMLNIDACRLPAEGSPEPQVRPTTDRGGASWSKGEHVPFHYSRKGEASASRRYADEPGDFAALPGPRGGDPSGRWPANVLLSDPELFDEPNPWVVGSGATSDPKPERVGLRGGTAWHGMEGFGSPDQEGRWPADPGGGYSRFFLIPKAARTDREPVLGGLPLGNGGVLAGSQDGALNKRTNGQPPAPRANVHPTVKPTDLMRHLVRLVTPTGGTVLDPFLGSGTTGLAAEMEGFAWIGIEREAEYVAIAEARLNGTQRGLGLESA